MKLNMLTYHKGDLFSTPDLFIAHGCNAQGVMGAGVALQVKTLYPEVFEDYKELCSEFKNKSELLGEVLSVEVEGKTIINCFTQLNFSSDGSKQVSYDSVDKCMIYVSKFLNLYDKLKPLKEHKFKSSISMPKIGAGLGGGNWEVIEAIIKHRLADVNVKIWEL